MKDEPHQLRRRAISIELLDRQPGCRISAEFSIAPQSLGNSFVFVMQDSRQRPQQVGSENGSLILGKSSASFSTFSHCGHRKIITSGATKSKQRRRGNTLFNLSGIVGGALMLSP